MATKHNSAIRKGSLNVIRFGLSVDHKAPKKPKRSKSARMAENRAVEGRFTGSYQDNIAKVGMR